MCDRRNRGIFGWLKSRKLGPTFIERHPGRRREFRFALLVLNLVGTLAGIGGVGLALVALAYAQHRDRSTDIAVSATVERIDQRFCEVVEVLQQGPTVAPVLRQTQPLATEPKKANRSDPPSKARKVRPKKKAGPSSSRGSKREHTVPKHFERTPLRKGATRFAPLTQTFRSVYDHVSPHRRANLGRRNFFTVR